ncbi:cell division protein FtsQ/DivIB [Bacillus toyonensis]|uniref:cell division protein FtsQ/DivIB n=1 Tax=Bacillus toyonensis TaxID=155322 RepID=UPI0018A1B193|nr:FtsQ-type POTRA domain-containing protein [Bacillus toyonensis]MBF7146478.1 FtsQ-type POTRA domain-containing protein [Bacillus toyonensis]MEC2350605.1 FtsQ-type POTRA domain-containing protein [Bacillus toyonensis]MED3185603.1 FtsQ-type POTRA domain-containing protein [Bacillus toyonensis]
MKKNNVYLFNQKVQQLKVMQNRKVKASRRKKALVICILIIVILLVCILFLNRSAKISKISVKGNETVSQSEIISLSNLSSKDNYWNLHKEDITKSIKKNKKIKEVNVLKKFPNQVVIDVKEHKTIAYKVKNNHYYPILENGTMLDKVINNQDKESVPVIKQFTSNDEYLLEKLISELKTLPLEIQNKISEIHFSPTDVENTQIILYTTDGFTVSALITDFSRKMKFYPSMIQKLDPKQHPVIHLDAMYANGEL